MNNQYGCTMKITATKTRKVFVTAKEEIVESNEIYETISRPIYSYFYELIQQIRLEPKADDSIPS